MKKEFPDWSLFSFLSKTGKSISGMVSSAKDGDGRVVMGIIGFAIAVWCFPISLCWFIFSNGFRVGTKTWVYFVIMIIVIIIITIQSVFHLH